MQVENKNAIELSPIFDYDYKNPFSPYKLLDEVLIDELFTPDKEKNVVIKDKNKKYDKDKTRDILSNCLNQSIDSKSEIFANKLFNEILTYKSKDVRLFDEIFVTQTANKNNLPYPNDKLIYTYATDIIPNAKKYLNDESKFDELFVSFDFVNKLSILAYSFRDEEDFSLYKKFIKKESKKIQNLDQQTINMFKDFDKLDLDTLTRTIILREKPEDNNEENSFQRILVSLSMKYFENEKNNDRDHIMPFSFKELLMPKTITFINIEKHANSTLKQINDSWNDIKKGLNQNLKIINTNKITKLQGESDLEKALSNLSKKVAKDVNQFTLDNLKIKTYKLKAIREKTPREYLSLLKKIIKKMENVSRSENSYKFTKNSFQRANRREPDNFNKQGKITSTKYKPDIHLYIDTSGSINEKNYRQSVKLAILIAKKLNVNLYFNSFSHYVSNSTKIPVKGKSTKQIYRLFEKIPKVSGGTDFLNVWNYINKSPKRRRELSLIITDFGDTIPNIKGIKSPKNLYYMPCSYIDFNIIKHEAEYFLNSAKFIDPKIRQKILI